MTSQNITGPASPTPAENGPDVAAPRTVQVLQTDTSWDGTRYERYPDGVPQLTVVRYSLPAHGSLPWHEHRVPNTAFVLSGSIVLTTIEGDTQVFRAGDAFAESVGNEHRGYTQDEATEIVCTYAGSKGIALSVPTGRATDGL